MNALIRPNKMGQRGNGFIQGFASIFWVAKSETSDISCQDSTATIMAGETPWFGQASRVVGRQK